jgi:RNA polymerase sigma-70 factor (ECF subfamily)
MSAEPAQGPSTLLHTRLLSSPQDTEAWEQFVARYSGPIYQWCRRYGLQDADARDVTQAVFSKLLRKLPLFERGRSRFRTWLYTIVHNAVADLCSERSHVQEKGTHATYDVLERQEARDDLQTRLQQKFDLELLEVAEKNIRLRVQPQTWKAYELRCKDLFSLAVVGQTMDMKIGTVSKYVRRVLNLLADEVKRLEENPEPLGPCEGRA